MRGPSYKEWETLEIGFTIGFAVLLGVGMGWLLGQWFGYRELFLTAGALLGIGSALLLLFRVLK